MEFELLATVLGLSKISLKSGILGGKSFASFDETQLEAIEKALGGTQDAKLTAEIEKLKQKESEQAEKMKALKGAVNSALELNGLESEEGASLESSINLLGETCKEYGSKQVVHTITGKPSQEVQTNDDGLVEGYIDPNAEHNQMLGIK